MTYDNRPNISCKQFIQETGDTFIFSGSNYFCGRLNSDLGYQIGCCPFFMAGNGLTSMRIGLSANTNSNSVAIGHQSLAIGIRSVSIGCGAQACCTESISIGDSNISKACGGSILGGHDNILSGVTGTTLIGYYPPVEGTSFCLNDPTYNYYVVVPNLAIKDITGSGGSYLCVDSNGKVSKTSGGGITWCGSTVDGIATYVDSTHVCSETGLTFNGSNLQFTNGIKCITMMSGTSSIQSLNICGSCSGIYAVAGGSVYICGGDSSAGSGGGTRLYGGTGWGGGGEVWLEGGRSCGNAVGGAVCLIGGNNTSSSYPAGAGGPIQICGGCSCRQDGGYVLLQGGCSCISNGGDICICAGNSTDSNGGNVLIEGGNGITDGCFSVKTGGNDSIVAYPLSGVTLYYNGSAKLKTIDTGVCVTGCLDASSGLILTSSGGTRYCLYVTNLGALCICAI